MPAGKDTITASPSRSQNCGPNKIINTEEKRRGVEALGSEMVNKLTYYERWIAASAFIRFQKGILTPDELAKKMDEVAARHAAG